MDSPIEIFHEWYKEELKLSSVRIPSACCFTSIGEDGYPNSRFVSLKEIINESFIITGPLNSRKGMEVRQNPKVSLSFWWTETEKQVRVQGDALPLSEAEARHYFSERSKDSQIVSSVFEQGKEIENFLLLEERFEKGKLAFDKKAIPKPVSWSGFSINPKRIELMEFMKTRLHKRTLFTRENAHWKVQYLQP